MTPDEREQQAALMLADLARRWPVIEPAQFRRKDSYDALVSLHTTAFRWIARGMGSGNAALANASGSPSHEGGR